MTQAGAFLAGAAAIALTFGVTGQTLAPVETQEPLSTNDILVVTNDTAAESGQTVESTGKLPKMGGDNLGDASSGE